MKLQRLSQSTWKKRHAFKEFHYYGVQDLTVNGLLELLRLEKRANSDIWKL